jgi:hypothetical protein
MICFEVKTNEKGGGGWTQRNIKKYGLAAIFR